MKTVNVDTLSIADLEVIGRAVGLPTLVEREVFALSHLSIHGIIQMMIQENGDTQEDVLQAVREAVRCYAARIENLDKFQAAIREYFAQAEEQSRLDHAVVATAEEIDAEDKHQQYMDYHH